MVNNKLVYNMIILFAFFPLKRLKQIRVVYLGNEENYIILPELSYTVFKYLTDIAKI